MGESRNRKNNDKFYGYMPKYGMGLVVSNPMTIEGNSMTFHSNCLDSALLRSHLLFWDRLVWPISRAIHIQGGADEDFLISCGILKRPDYSVFGSGGRLLLQSQINAFNDLNTREPGQWALSMGEGSTVLLDDDTFTPERGILLKLNNSIPVPDRDVPLNDILEFKQKRRDELTYLRLELDKLYDRIINSQDSEHALNSALTQINCACEDAIKVAKESSIPFKMSSWNLNISIDPMSIFSGVTAAAAALTSGVPIGGSLLTAASVSMATSVGIKQKTNSNKPFNYVTSIHKEFI